VILAGENEVSLNKVKKVATAAVTGLIGWRVGGQEGSWVSR
jgi:hypothetical protein